MLGGIDPYGGACAIRDGARTYPSNPLTAIVVALPFSPFGYLGALVMWACFVGVLVFGILTSAKSWRLLILTAAPFWESFWLLQWAPLITAIVFVPSILPLAMVKPHIGLPVMLTNLTRRRIAACAAFAALTLVIDPSWPFRWWPQAMNFDGFVPVAVPVAGTLLLGLLVFLALLNARDSRTQFLLLAALMPQRGFYDALPLTTISGSAPQLFAWSVLSWLGFFAGQARHDLYPQCVVMFLYLPLVLRLIVEALHVRQHRAH